MLDTSSRTVRLGLIGSGIQLSRSPALHEAEGRANGLALSYELIDLDLRKLGVDGLSSLLREAEDKGFAGVNVTHPAKQAVIAELDELSPEARVLGAVNTVVFRDGARIGHNTDGRGFGTSFRRSLPDADLGHVVQLGAGGAGVAVAHAIAGVGARRITIFDPDARRSQMLTEQLRRHFPELDATVGSDLGAAMRAASGLLHATPTGMAAHPGLPLPANMIEPRHWVAEIVYFPLETELLKVARAKGCPTVDGGGMVVFQAAAAFRLFTGREPDPERMLRHFATLVGRS